MVSAPPRTGWRVGVDIGGTFTDFVIMDPSGNLRIEKTLTTPEDLIEAIFRGLSQSGVPLAGIEYLAHGTTQGSNAVIERKGARTALVTTQGFRDVLEIRRGQRAITDPRDTYNLQKDLPQSYVGGRLPLIERRDRHEVPERVDVRGEIRIPLDEAALRGVARTLKEDRVESVAVSFLFSYLNPAHERRAGEILREELPGVPVSLSHEILPVIREYERTSTTVINAYIQPRIATYLERLESRLREQGFQGLVTLMQSHGGIMTSPRARQRPVHILESGPAAGVAAVEWLGRRTGTRHLLSLDVGGTTAKVCLVRDYHAETTTNFWIEDDHFLGIPVTDLVEIGAGGGTLARVDEGGALLVGPESAGSQPGPACYGLGGTGPTVTDANLLQGYLNPQFFLGGAMPLKPDLAARAIREALAKPLGVSLEQAARGIIQIVNANMSASIRVMSVQRGYDPRDFTLVGFGGSGPLHAAELAAGVGIPRLLFPRIPGNFSALGLLVSDLKHEAMRSFVSATRQADPGALSRAFGELESETLGALAEQGVARRDVTLLRAADLRYMGQAHEIKVPVPGGPLRPRTVHQVERTFHRLHEQHFSYRAEEAEIEIITLRVTGLGRIPKPRERPLPQSEGASPSRARKGERMAFFEGPGKFVRTAVYDRSLLRPGHRIAGPALVEQLDTTLVLPPGSASTLDRYGNLLTRLSARPRRARRIP